MSTEHRPPCIDGSVCGESAHCPPMTEQITTAAPDEREDFTDIVLSIDGDHGLDDPVVMRALDVAVPQIEKLLGGDVLVSSHHCNDDGETFRTVSAERDALAATVARVEALVIGDFDPERSDVTVAAIRAAIHPKGDHRG